MRAKPISSSCSAVREKRSKGSAPSMNGTTAVRKSPYAETCGSINMSRRAATRSTSFAGFITRIIPRRWTIYSVTVTANWSDHRLWKRNLSSRSCSQSPTIICGGSSRICYFSVGSTVTCSIPLSTTGWFTSRKSTTTPSLSAMIPTEYRATLTSAARAAKVHTKETRRAVSRNTAFTGTAGANMSASLSRRSICFRSFPCTRITGRITAMPPPVRFPTAFYFRC